MSGTEGDDLAKQKSKFLRRIKKSGSPVYDPESYSHGGSSSHVEASGPSTGSKDDENLQAPSESGDEAAAFMAQLQALRAKQHELRSRITERMAPARPRTPAQSSISSGEPLNSPSDDPEPQPKPAQPTIQCSSSTPPAGGGSSSSSPSSPDPNPDSALAGAGTPPRLSVDTGALPRPPAEEKVHTPTDMLDSPSSLLLDNALAPSPHPNNGPDNDAIAEAAAPAANDIHGFPHDSPVAQLLSRSSSLHIVIPPAPQAEVEVATPGGADMDNQARALREQVARLGRTNQELKRMLVAAFGSTLANEIATLTALKVELGDLVTQLSATNDGLESALAETILERDLYRAKFTAAEVMIHELSSGEVQLSAMLDESNRQQAALQASHTAVSHMVTDCADLLMAIIARLARSSPVTLALDAHESEGVLEAARAHRKAGALDHLCEANLMLVGLLANSLVMKLAAIESAPVSARASLAPSDGINFSQCCPECKGPVFYA